MFGYASRRTRSAGWIGKAVCCSRFDRLLGFYELPRFDGRQQRNMQPCRFACPPPTRDDHAPSQRIAYIRNYLGSIFAGALSNEAKA